jgi:NADPH:quinone reductase-like Zn-dependent oxidoreductase
MNPMDVQIANGGWKDLMPATFPMVLGADLAGVVEEGAPGALRFARGDEVFGQLLVPPLGSAGDLCGVCDGHRGCAAGPGARGP